MNSEMTKKYMLSLKCIMYTFEYIRCGCVLLSHHNNVNVHTKVRTIVKALIEETIFQIVELSLVIDVRIFQTFIIK